MRDMVNEAHDRNSVGTFGIFSDQDDKPLDSPKSKASNEDSPKSSGGDIKQPKQSKKLKKLKKMSKQVRKANDYT